jgi:uncharacterized protein with PIN domain
VELDNPKLCLLCKGKLVKVTTGSVVRRYPHFFGLQALTVIDDDGNCRIEESFSPLKTTVWRCEECGYLHLFDSSFD